MYMHSVDFGTIENFAGKITKDGKYSGAGKFSPHMSSFIIALLLHRFSGILM